MTDFDGNTYTTVIIGTQEWMTENLRTTHYADGTVIPNLTADLDWTSDIIGAYCWYNNNGANKAIYGGLYNWYAVNNVHGLAPRPMDGWRIPTLTDFNIFIASVGGNPGAGGELKESGTTHWIAPNTGAVDNYNFTAIPGGERSDVAFDNLGNLNGIWTLTSWGIDSAYICQLTNLSANASMSVWFQLYGLSVRCVRDHVPSSSTSTTTTISTSTSTTTPYDYRVKF